MHSKRLKQTASFIKDKWLLMVMIVFLSVTLGLSMRFFSSTKETVLTGLFMINSSALAVVLAIHNYQAEQRTSRLQHVYFEDALLGQAKAIEDILSQTNRNHQFAKKWFSYAIEIFDTKSMLLSIEAQKNYAIEDLSNTLKNISFSINTTDFKKETIYKLMVGARMEQVLLFDWIQAMEEDAYAFYAYIKLMMCAIKQESFSLSEFYRLNQQALAFLKNNYLLIKRHYIVFNLFSQIVLEFSAANYATQDKIYVSFLKPKIKKLIDLLNQSYLDVIEAYSTERVGSIGNACAVRLDVSIQQTIKTNLAALI